MSRAAEMRGLIKRWEASGLSQRAFTEQEDVSYSAFQYWRRRLRDMPSGEAVQLDPVRIIPERVLAPSAFEVRTSGGMTLSVPAGFDEFELRRLLDVLAGC
jgi:hypothetical protein